MPEASVGARREQGNVVKNNTTYEEITLYCEETETLSYKTVLKRPIGSDVWIGPENLGQGTATNDIVRGPSKEANRKSGKKYQAGHIVPNAGGGCGTDPDNIFIQDQFCNQSLNKQFDSEWIDCVNKYKFRVNLIHEFEYSSPNSTSIPDIVKITAKIYRPDQQKKIATRSITFQNDNDGKILHAGGMNYL